MTDVYTYNTFLDRVLTSSYSTFDGAPGGLVSTGGSGGDSVGGELASYLLSSMLGWDLTLQYIHTFVYTCKNQFVSCKKESC